MNWTDTDATSANPGRWTIHDSRTGKHYKLETFLGKGAFGEVYAATVTNGSGPGRRDYALKVLSRNSPHVRKGLAKEEVAIMSKLRHENVVQSFGYFFKFGHFVIVLERCMNVTLCRLVHFRGALTIAETRLYSRQLCCGVKYLHTLRVVHHDIKASNVLFGVDGKLKISDFGLSRKLGPNETIPAWRGGFAEYFAPEILAAKQPYGFGVDIWSLGCVVYYMLVGFYPFALTKDQTAMDSLAKILSCSYNVPEHVRQENPAIVDFLAKMLVRVDRRASIHVLMQHEFFAGLSTPVVLPSIASPHLGDRQPSLASALESVDAWLNIRRLPQLLSDLITYGPVLDGWEISEMRDAELFPCVPVVEVISLKRTRPWEVHWLKGYFFVLNNGSKGCAFDDGTAITLYLNGTHFQFTESQHWTATVFSVANPPSAVKTKLGMVLRKFCKYKKNVQHQSGTGDVAPVHHICAVMKVHSGYNYLCTLLTNGQVHLLYPERKESAIFCPASEAVTCKKKGMRTTYDLDVLCDVGISEDLREQVEEAASLVGDPEQHPHLP